MCALVAKHSSARAESESNEGSEHAAARMIEHVETEASICASAKDVHARCNDGDMNASASCINAGRRDKLISSEPSEV